MPSRRSAPWYAVQVLTGRELATLRLVRRAVESRGVAVDAFVPRREAARHVGGQWSRVSEVLFPGYLFVATRDPEGALDALARVPAFSRMLGQPGALAPLSDPERNLVSALSGGGRVARMSKGVVEGGRVRVLEGPLAGLETMVSKVDRHKRCAYVRVPLLGREVDVKVGLEVVDDADA